VTRPGVAALEGCERPSPARVCDYLLGGAHNFAVDRAFAARVPWLRPVVRSNRAFGWRAVRWCLHAGVRQFLDLGSGVPTLGAAHETAERAGAPARVVYVDSDPVTAAVAEQLLAAKEQAAAVHADLRCPARVLAAPACRRLLDFDRPMAVLLTGVLHLLPDDPAPIVAGYRQAMAPGSCLLLSHATEDRLGGQRPDAWGAWDTWPRPGGQVGALFAGFDLLSPGLVRTGHWHPQDSHEQDPGALAYLAGLARSR
jgi:SAM-dependent methyltransferase